jgi:thiol-disulfide isomerase/thioredoxin
MIPTTLRTALGRIPVDWNLKLPNEWKPKLLILVLLGAAAGASYRIQTLPETTEAHLVPNDREAPRFSLRDVSGKLHRLEDFRGKAVILNFMATWCGPCEAEVPILLKFAREHENDPLVIIGIDYDEPALRVARFVRGRGIDYLVLVDEGGRVSDAYGVRGFPTTYFIDGNGLIRSAYVGAFEGIQGDSMFRQLVDNNLGQFIAQGRKERRHCAPPPSTAPNTLGTNENAIWALRRVACACGCSAKVTECDCGERRGGREIREYYAHLRLDPDFSVENAIQIVIWKYKNAYVW